MAEEYDVQAIINALREKEEMDPDRHDGCYELMRETIEAYGKLEDFSTLDYKDLNLVYLTSVGTWKQGIDSKKKTVNDEVILDAGDMIGYDTIFEAINAATGTNYQKYLSQV